jgi:hypothetical protein
MCSRRDQVPGRRKNRTEGAASKNVVVHVLNRRLARARVVKHVIWAAVAVEIGGSLQFIVICEG